AAATAEAAAALASAAAPASAAPATVVVDGPRVHDRLDVADRGRREAHPRGERRVAGLDALRLLRAHRGPLHRLAVVAALGLQRLEDRLGSADALDRRREPRLRAGGAGRRRRRSLQGLLLRLGLDGLAALGHRLALGIRRDRGVLALDPGGLGA